MNRKQCSLLVVVLLLLMISLCSCGDVIVEPKWIIGVKGADSYYFSSIDYTKLREVTIVVEKEQHDGTVLEETWKGIYLKDVLDYLDVAEYSSVTLSSSDDFAIEYSPEIINDSLTILATNVNGRDIKHEDGYVQAVAGNQPENMWIKPLSKISVNK